MATKAKKKSPAKKAAPETAKPAQAAKKDPKDLNREISNALLTDEERAGMFFAKYWKKLLALAVIAVVAVTGIFAYTRHSEAVKNKAVAGLARAKTVEEIKAELAKNPNIPGADAARFRMAKIYAEEKKYGDAIKTLEELTKSEDTAVGNRARLNIAYLLEIDGKTDEALKRFSALTDTTVLSAAERAEAGYAAGRLYLKLNKKDEAKKILRTVRSLKINPQEQRAANLWQERAAELENSIN
jgi:hypothetical protein